MEVQLFDISHTNLLDKNKNPLTSLELFAGAGGMALGVHKAGFQHIGLVEWNNFAVDTLKENSQKLLSLDPNYVIQADARELDYQSLAGKLDLLTGGPPCQPFSTGGRNKGSADERNMFPIVFDIVATTNPKAILLENVRGLLREKFDKYIDYIVMRLRFPHHKINPNEDWRSHYIRLLRVTEQDFLDDEKYDVCFQMVDTADYGVPQRRERVLFTAFRKDLGIESFNLSPTHSKQALLIDQWITGKYWRQYGIPPFDYLGPKDKRIVAALRTNLNNDCNLMPWVTVRDTLSDLPMPVPRGYKEEIINHVQHPGARVYPGHVGSHYDYPSKALKAGTHGTPGGENILVMPPDCNVRYFTTREAARLQTFPDDYRFHGTWGACIKQLGNAVPVELIRLYSTEIRKRLSS